MLLISIAWYSPTLHSFLKPWLISRGVLGGAVPPVLIQQASATVEQGLLLVYPKLGVTAPVSTHANDWDPFAYEGWREMRNSLRNGLGMSYSGENLDTSANLLILGHSSDVIPHQYAGVFAGLGAAEVGDAFILRHNGKSYTFTVTERHTLDPRDESAFLELFSTKDASKQQAALVTCWPILTDNQRLVVIGERTR